MTHSLNYLSSTLKATPSITFPFQYLENVLKMYIVEKAFETRTADEYQHQSIFERSALIRPPDLDRKCRSKIQMEIYSAGDL